MIFVKCISVKINLILVAFLLSACGNVVWPISYEIRDINLPRTANAVVHQSLKSDIPSKLRLKNSIAIKRGDTVFAVARRYKISPVSIIKANALKPPYRLTIGQKILLPIKFNHTVSKGETLYSIAQKYGTEIYALSRLNFIKPPYLIMQGDTLALPGSNRTRTINQLNQVSSKALINKPLSGLNINKVKIKRSHPRKPASSKLQYAGDNASVRSKKKLQTVASGKQFVWPLRGRLISRFGPKKNGLHNDGINIAAPIGTVVMAAKSGIVVYAGNELRGFGNLLLLKHSNGWVTAYAHNKKLFVNRGDKVTRGQKIATVGKTGGVSQPQLHFEIRRGRKAQNPARYL